MSIIDDVKNIGPMVARPEHTLGTSHLASQAKARHQTASTSMYCSYRNSSMRLTSTLTWNYDAVNFFHERMPNLLNDHQ